MAIARPGLYTLVVVGGGITSNQLGVAVTLCAASDPTCAGRPGSAAVSPCARCWWWHRVTSVSGGA